MEKLNPKVVALSLGIAIVIVDLICLLFLIVLPMQTTIKVTNYLMHGIDISSIATKDITLTGSVIGLFEWFVIAAVSGYIFAVVYNWIIEKF